MNLLASIKAVQSLSKDASRKDRRQTGNCKNSRKYGSKAASKRSANMYATIGTLESKKVNTKTLGGNKEARKQESW